MVLFFLSRSERDDRAIPHRRHFNQVSRICCCVAPKASPELSLLTPICELAEKAETKWFRQAPVLPLWEGGTACTTPSGLVKLIRSTRSFIDRSNELENIVVKILRTSWIHYHLLQVFSHCFKRATRYQKHFPRSRGWKTRRDLSKL